MNVDQVLGGTTPRWGLTIRDEFGTIVDPEDVDKIAQIYIEVYNEDDKAVLAKFAYPAKTGYITAVIENYQVTFVLDSTITTGAAKNIEFGVTAEVHFKVAPGLGYPDNINIDTKRGTLVLFKDPKE